MDLFCYDSSFNVVHHEKFILEDTTLPHIKKDGGKASIELSPKEKTIVFEQDGISHTYTQVDYKVNFALQGYSFEIHKAGESECTVVVSEAFALRNITCIIFSPDNYADSENRSIMRANGYTV